MDTLIETPTTHPLIVRTSRGLSLTGTRITLYSIMDFIKAEWPPKLIRDEMNLTDAQIQAVIQYIADHHDEVWAEYDEVVSYGEEIRRRAEAELREREALIAKLPPRTNYPEARAKLAALKAKRNGQ